MDIQTLHAGNTLVLEPGTELNQYKILKVLGQGTFGITYLAVNLTLNQHVAIKEFLPEPVAYREHSNTVRPKSANDQLTFQHFKQRFLEEAQNLALFKHQNIVRINGYFEANETAYMVMDYETGISLEQQLAQGYRYSEAELTSFVRQLSSGLHRLHQVGIIHRDIKPDNIFIRAHDNSPVLLDFGSARHALHQKTQDMTTLLTVGYAPIEQYSTNGTRQGPWTDIYSLAAVCYELVTGNRPMESTIRSETKMRTGSDPLPLAAETAKNHFSHAFLQLIDQGLAMLAEDRPQSIEGWQTSLDQLNRTKIQDIEALQQKLSEPPLATHHQLNQQTNNRTVIPFPIQADTPPPTEIEPNKAETPVEKPTNLPTLTLTITFPTFKYIWEKHASVVILVCLFCLGLSAPILIESVMAKDFTVISSWFLFLSLNAMTLYLIANKTRLSTLERRLGITALSVGTAMLLVQLVMSL